MWHNLDSQALNPIGNGQPSPLTDADRHFRGTMTELGLWSLPSERLFVIMAYTDPQPVSWQQRNLLPQVVQAALNHAEIGAKFPKFFQQLLANPLLRQAFMLQIETSQ